MSLATVRNILIICAIAAVIVIVPGGGTGASVVTQAVSLAFLAAIAWFASITYRQHRLTLYGLGDRRRAILYGALAVAAVTLTATHRMWTGGGLASVAWLVLIGGCAYAVFAVVWSARKY